MCVCVCFFIYNFYIISTYLNLLNDFERMCCGSYLSILYFPYFHFTSLCRWQISTSNNLSWPLCQWPSLGNRLTWLWLWSCPIRRSSWTLAPFNMELQFSGAFESKTEGCLTSPSRKWIFCTFSYSKHHHFLDFFPFRWVQSPTILKKRFHPESRNLTQAPTIQSPCRRIRYQRHSLFRNLQTRRPGGELWNKNVLVDHSWCCQ